MDENVNQVASLSFLVACTKEETRSRINEAEITLLVQDLFMNVTFLVAQRGTKCERPYRMGILFL